MDHGREDRTGRILRVKQGYNPNSSSMGSMLFVVPGAILAITVVFGAAAGAIASAVMHRHPPSPGTEAKPRPSDEPNKPDDSTEEPKS